MHRLLAALPLLLALTASQASADDLSVSAGYGQDSEGSSQIPIVLTYDHALGSGALLLVVRGDLDLNADRPDGQLMKGADCDLQIGLEWQSAADDQVRLVAGGLLGPVLYTEPGYGVAARGVLGGRVPLAGARLWLNLEASGTLAYAQLGDESTNDSWVFGTEIVLGLGARL